jgi:hypothetical protein
MLCQQLRIFVFMAVAMVRLSAAAHFDCDNTLGYIFCDISLNSDNDFNFSGEDDTIDCTRDGKYCARVQTIPNDNTQWKISVLNNGGGTTAFCYGTCPVQRLCNDNGGDCYDACLASLC